MTDTLTIREFTMLRDAVFQRSADSRTEREEDRWLGLDAKLQRLNQQLERERCNCGHARKSHRTATEEVSTCRICDCTRFTPGTQQCPRIPHCAAYMTQERPEATPAHWTAPSARRAP